MNYLAHALPFLDRPYFAAGTAVPDWLMVADRSVRLRSKHIEASLEKGEDDGDPCTREVAAGALQHLRDDARFHATRAFAETTLELAALVRKVMRGETGGRTSAVLLSHLLVEILLDASLAAENTRRLDEYYRLLDGIDPYRVETAVNRFARRPTERLAPFIELFRRERVLCDYAEDGRLMRRLNQIMRRVGLDPLPDEFAALLPVARTLVFQRRRELWER